MGISGLGDLEVLPGEGSCLHRPGGGGGVYSEAGQAPEQRRGWGGAGRGVG